MNSDPQLAAPVEIPRALSGLVADDWSVSNWHPTPDASGPPAGVGLELHVGEMAPISLLLKSAAEVDELIAALRRHRLAVWPSDPKRDVEALQELVNQRRIELGIYKGGSE